MVAQYRGVYWYLYVLVPVCS
eukprot:SAG11_NODE_46431_length_136_cov_110.216216_1_plen_20_part_10